MARNLQKVRFTSADPMRIGSAKNEKAMFRNFKVLMIVLVVIVIAGSAYAFANANTGVTASKAGEGTAAISGYAVSGISYTLHLDDATLLDAVVFTLDAAATNVKVQVVADADWYTCTNTLFVWTCATTSPQATVAAMDSLTIVATDQ